MQFKYKNNPKKVTSMELLEINDNRDSMIITIAKESDYVVFTKIDKHLNSNYILSEIITHIKMALVSKIVT